MVDGAARQRLEVYCAAVERATGAEIALVVLPSLENEPVEDVANTIFRAWGVGQKGSNEGIMMLLAIGDHRDRLEVGYGLEPILPDGFDGRVLRQMAPALRQQQYGQAMIAAAQTIGETIAHAKNVTLTATLPRTIRPQAYDAIPWQAILGVIFVIVWLFRSAGGPRGMGGGGPGGLLTGLLLGSMMGGGRGSFGGGGGGFGGFDSGGGFGGFGGGDSGGGGASGGW